MDCFSKQKGDVPSSEVPPSKIKNYKWSPIWYTFVAQGRNDNKNRNLDAYRQISRGYSQLKTELRP
jgi:hypothetical protein